MCINISVFTTRKAKQSKGKEKMEAMEEDMISSPSLPLSSITHVSESTLYPDQPSNLGRVNLSAFDLRFLFCHYVQNGLLFTQPSLPSSDLLNHLRSSLSRVLSLYPPLAGRLSTNPDGSFSIACNDAGVDFVHAAAPQLSLADVEVHGIDLPDVTKELFPFNGVVNLEGRSSPVAAVQVTELADGVFVGCSINHAVADGHSFWSFFHSWSEICRGVEVISKQPDFRRGVLEQPVPCITAAGGPPGPAAPPIRECTFHFSREAIHDLKARANSSAGAYFEGGEISSFQSLCTQLWRSVTRARKLNPGTETSLRMLANCRLRLDPPLGIHYFGNAVLPIVTVAKAEEVVGRELGPCAQLVHRNVAAFGDEAVKKAVEKWMEERRPLELGNPHGTSLVITSSPRFAVFENDMGWGRPVAVICGPGNKFDGTVTAYPGRREGGGSIDLEVCLPPETMERLVSDGELMQYVAH